jgi:hypothetical protein
MSAINGVTTNWIHPKTESYEVSGRLQSRRRTRKIWLCACANLTCAIVNPARLEQAALHACKSMSITAEPTWVVQSTSARKGKKKFSFFVITAGELRVQLRCIQCSFSALVVNVPSINDNRLLLELTLKNLSKWASLFRYGLGSFLCIFVKDASMFSILFAFQFRIQARVSLPGNDPVFRACGGLFYRALYCCAQAYIYISCS